MLRRACILLLAAGLIAGPQLLADEAAQDDKNTELKTVVVVNGLQGDVNDVKKLPREFRLVAESLKHPKATYKIDGSTLRIGLEVAAIEGGVELERLEFRSDCPDNSQYKVQSILAGRKEALRATTVAWTRHRHNAPRVPLRTVNISQLAANTKNYDVQLDIKKVSLLTIRQRR